MGRIKLIYRNRRKSSVAQGFGGLTLVGSDALEYGVSCWGDKNVQTLIQVMVAQPCEYNFKKMLNHIP